MKINTEIFSQGEVTLHRHTDMRAFNNRPRSKKPGGPFAVRWAALRLPLFFILFISMGLFACGGNDTAGITLSQTMFTLTDPAAGSEGTSASYTVALDSQPTGNVALMLESSDMSSVTLDTDMAMDGAQSALTFTDSDWNTPQTVTLTAVDDPDLESESEVTITHTIDTEATMDEAYAALSDLPSVTVMVNDEDTDSDQDGVADDNDAFPSDPCAATDTDGDGDPDSIVAGCSTSLTEDTDDDNDGIADANEAEGQRLLPDCGGAPTPTATMQDGNPANPYCIDTLAELQSIETGFTNGYTTGNSVTRTRAQSLGYHYRLVANIDAWPTNSASSRPGSITYVDGSTAAPAAYDSSSYANGFDPIGDCGTAFSCTDADTPPLLR